MTHIFPGEESPAVELLSYPVKNEFAQREELDFIISKKLFRTVEIDQEALSCNGARFSSPGKVANF